jgi:hypothetical protein
VRLITLLKKSKKTLSTMKTKSCAFALFLTMAASALLTGCAGASLGDKASLLMYQPRILPLKAGTPIQTAAGIYTPRFDEIWHSAAAYQELESQLIDLAAARAQRRNTVSPSRQ